MNETEKYRKLIEATGTGFVILDDKGLVLDANQTYVSLTGRQTFAEIQGHGVDEWTAPYEKERNLAAVKQCFEQGFIRRLEIDYIAPNGKITPVEIDATVAQTDTGVQILSLVRDITERKQVEKELAETKILLEAVFEQSSLPMIVASVSDMVIRMANFPALKLLGIADEESHVGKSLFEAKQTWQNFDTNGNPLTMADLPLAKALQGIETRSREMMIKRKDGSIAWEIVDGVPIYNKEGQLIAGVIISLDITERKRAETNQARLQQEVIEAQQHAIAELSTPVIPIMDRIIVMPLIGSIDSLRARDITRSLLAGIQQHRAKVVILDVTGVGIMDTGIVNHLNKTIQAARLKGAQTIVTGMSDAVAEAIVDLGIDWSGVTTLSDLQTGLIVALENLGVKLSKV